MEINFIENLKLKYNLLYFELSLFKEKSKVGSGGFGTVYLTRYKQLNAAIKDPNDNCKSIQLEKEIINILALRHMKIPRLYGISDSLSNLNGVSLVFVYIKGQTFTLYSKSKPSQIEILSHLIDLTFTLEYLHKNGVIHRDLKPDNLMIDTNTFSLKLLDFGISKKTLHEETNTVIVGTPLYMAPENFDIVFGTGASMQVTNVMKISNKVDIWALGIIINQLLSNEEPWLKYKGSDVSVLFIKGIRFPISDKIKDDDIRQLITSCTEPLPNKRCSISYVKKQLMKVLHNLCKNLKKNDLINEFIQKEANCHKSCIKNI